jgi:hypothetical protein
MGKSPNVIRRLDRRIYPFGRRAAGGAPLGVDARDTPAQDVNGGK